jgi:endo-1,4-beta-mannosidase
VSGGEYRDVAARNWFEDPQIIEAQALLAREAASALRAHEALLAWDLGNENSNVCVPPSRDAGRAWLARMSDELRRVDPSCRITIGLHMEDLEHDRRIGPREAAEVCDFLCMHGYPLYAPWARSKTDAALPAFLADVTRWLGRKDVYFEEFGMPAPTGDEEMQDAFIGKALELLYERGTLGAMLWCFADYVKEIWDQPPLDVAPHERFFGIWRADGRPKPAARHFAPYAGATQRQTAAHEFDADADTFYDAPHETLQRLYAQYTNS